MCNPTQKSYIGVTTQGISIRWCKHISAATHGHDQCTLLNRAIMKYGKDAFVIEVIASVIDDVDLYEMEKLLIVQEGTLSPNGYNLSSGGRGISKHHEDTKRRIADALRGVSHSEERITHIRSVRQSSPMYGISHRELTYRGLKKYRVRIGIDGQTVHIGDYTTLEEAMASRDRILRTK